MKSKKKILVTGSQGFIGKTLVRTLLDQDFEVEEFDLGHGDIVNYTFQFEKLDHVFHLASRTYVPASWEHPLDFYNTNVIGTVNILEACKAHRCPLSYISSYVYGTPHYLPVDEKHPINPVSPYNHSKLVAEEICRYYSQTFHFPVAVLRPVNIYGPGQRDEFLIPTIIRQVLDNDVEKIEVMDLRPKRDYLFIDDFIEALMATLGNKSMEIYNIGSGYSVSVEDIIISAMKKANINKPYAAKNIERKNEIWDVYVDISKIKEILKWQPKTSFEEGITLCIEAFNTK